MFSQAQEFSINGGQFTNVERGDVSNFHVYNMETDARHGRAMNILRQNIASGAFYDSAERFDPPKCHPQTRKAIIRKIMEWIEDPENLRYFLWMYGPAGAGKSAIAQTVAEMCAKAGILAASFFFSRTSPGRNNKTHFIASLSYQLSLSIPGMRVHVATAVEHDPSIFSRSLFSQMQALIINPLKQTTVGEETQGPLSSRPRFIIIDGLDECDNANTSSQTEILDALAASVNELTTPLLFLIASRPEHDIRQAFNSSSMRSLMTGMPLDDSYKPDADICVFLKAKFAEIKEKHPSRAYLPAEWPSVHDINHLVYKSSGQFIYAVTVMKYIDSRHILPTLRLKVVLGLLSAENDADRPFGQLDALYHHILSSVYDANLPKALEILSWSILDSKNCSWPLAFADNLFSHHSGDTLLIMSDLHALLHIPEVDSTDQRLRILHASFSDFLLDQSRSGRCAYLTAELQADLYNFEVNMSLSITGSDKDGMWNHLARILNFIAWLEHKMLPDPRKDVYHHLLLSIQNEVYSHFSQYPEILQRHLPTALTLSPLYLSKNTHVVISKAHIQAKDQALFHFHEFYHLWAFDFGDRTFHMPNSLLCSLLENAALPMAGGYFVDQSKYTDLAIQIAGFLFPTEGRPCMAQRSFNASDGRYIASKFLAVTLSKSSPAAKLAEVLRDNVLRFNTSSVPAEEYRSEIYKEALTELAIASLVYIKQCNITFQEHSHKNGDDVCYVCLSQEWEDELSVEPVAERVEEVVPLPPQRLLPLVLFAWFVRLLEFLMRLPSKYDRAYHVFQMTTDGKLLSNAKVLTVQSLNSYGRAIYGIKEKLADPSFAPPAVHHKL
ncbi:hypothetical protein BDZ97DRAFT_2057926 [Flammula alnicola]|nr:hypothetical protein BDZ97DRAFT_2057926 [Flammula alnicola]